MTPDEVRSSSVDEDAKSPVRWTPEALALVSHDLRNALSSITTSLHVLRMQGLNGPGADRARQTLERQSDQLIRLADQLHTIARSEPTADEVDDSLRLPAPDRPHRILIVDDNRDAADSIATLLRLWGEEVYSTYDGATALALARELHPHVCLLDIWMPGMNGYQLAEKLRQEPGLQHTVLVAMTGFAQEWDGQLALEAGFNTRLIKPVEVAALRALLMKSEVTSYSR
jgi:CheY-like chemotaxis protein